MGLKGLLILKTIVFSEEWRVSRGDLALFGELLAVLSLLIVVIVSFLSLRNMNRYNSTFDSLKNLVGKDAEGQIVMDERIVAIIDAVGGRLFQSAKMSALQGLSVDSKLEKGLLAAMGQDVIDEKLPLIQAAADYLGFNTKAFIKKNPKAIFQLVGLAQKYSGGFNLGGLFGGRNPQNNPGNRGRM